MNTEKQRSVWDLKVGETSTIQSFANIDMASKFLAVGIIPSAQLTMVRYSPFRSAVCIKLGDTYMALRNQEAKCILID